MKSVAFLRGINVGGANLVSMADLKALAESLGFQEVQTVLQSGNLVFRHDRPSGSDLEHCLELETEAQLGIRPDYFVRAGDEYAKVIELNPMPAQALEDPGRFVIMFLKSEPTAEMLLALRAAHDGPEIFEAIGRHVYATYPNGQGATKLTNAFIERKLGIRGTARNWNTILRVARLLEI